MTEEWLRAPDTASRVELRLLAWALRPQRRWHRILDLGCGSGRLFGTLRVEGSTYVGMDVDRQALQWGAAAFDHARAGGVLQGDGSHLPFVDSSFSAVVAVRVYHRVESSEGLLREIARVLEPGGRLVLLVQPRPSLLTLAVDLQNEL
ncbi:MAG: class I SAM-dependent methyltransferase [Thermoplasmata archaeon]|nr:class I SAM-dependent methyltransferase [Thermoplasmata archaeon]